MVSSTIHPEVLPCLPAFYPINPLGVRACMHNIRGLHFIRPYRWVYLCVLILNVVYDWNFGDVHCSLKKIRL